MRRLNHNPRLESIVGWALPGGVGARAAQLLLITLVSILMGPALQAQDAGQAEVALQSYYLGGSSGSLLGTSGISINTSQFLPGRGLFTTSVEGYGSNGFRTGNVFASLQGYAKWGWHWDFTGGDFRFSSNLVESPFSNVYSPEIAARGFRIAMKRKDRSYQFFLGKESILAGPRVPYRVLVPQMVLGATMQQKVGERWEFGLRYLQLSTAPSAFTGKQTTFTTSGRDFTNSNSLTFQSTYTLVKRPDTRGLKFYGEANLSRASTFTAPSAPRQQLSFLAGPSWEGDKFSVRGNYVRQSATYLPLLGYFVGDRKGSYAESHFRPLHWVDLFGSASEYSNNLDSDPNLPTFRSSGYSAGSAFLMPWRFSLGGSLSSVHLTQFDPARQDNFPSANRQVSLNLSRPIQRHSVRASFIDMKVATNQQLQRQRFYEAGDTFAWKRLVIGGSVRMQNSKSTESRNTLFYHGSVSINVKSLSVYANIDKGKDLVNKSIFSTNAVSSTVIGINTPLKGGWNMQFEAFKNNLNTDLNPANIFLFGNTGPGLNTQLSASNQWSVYLRISKQFKWGKDLPGGSSMEQYAAARVPLVGTLQGLVMEQSLAGPQPSPNVTISLDGDRNAVTDSKGHYLFTDVPEGLHDVALNMEQLPTDYDPGAKNRDRVAIAPRSMVRTDFTVYRLTFLTGKVVAPKDVPIDGIVIRLAGTKLYTTPDPDGGFSFSNLREGEYNVLVDEKTVPEGYLPALPSNFHVETSAANPAASIEFHIDVKPVEEKPVREILQPQAGDAPAHIVAPAPKPKE